MAVYQIALNLFQNLSYLRLYRLPDTLLHRRSLAFQCSPSCLSRSAPYRIPMTDNRLSMNMAKYGKETFTNHDISWKQLNGILPQYHLKIAYQLTLGSFS